jgi:glutamate dehydrogenase
VLAFIGDEEFRETLPDREELLQEAARLAGPDESLARLVELYWSLVADDDLVGRSAHQLLETTAHHRRMAEVRAPGQIILELDCPEDAEGPDAASSTRVDIVCDDSPFLVDSISGLFNKHGVDVSVFVHPIVPVRRDEDGNLQEAPAADGRAESWMHIETQRVADTAFLAELEADILEVLSDVGVCVADWQAMRAKALQIAEDLDRAATGAEGTTPLPVPPKDIDDTVELLRWLADDKFTFLGFRQYRLTGEGDDEALTPMGETGLGLLRKAPAAPRPLASFNTDARAQIGARWLLVITK